MPTMTCILFSHARAIYTRDSGKNTDENMPFLPGMPLKPSQLSINVVSETVPVNFNLLCEGQKGHNTGQKGLLRDKSDKMRPFRTKGQRVHLFDSVFSGRSLARAVLRGATAHRFTFLCIMNLSRYE